MNLDEAQTFHAQAFDAAREHLSAHDCCGILLISVYPNEGGRHPIICGSIGNREPIERHALLSLAFGEIARMHARTDPVAHGSGWRARFLRWWYRKMGLDV